MICNHCLTIEKNQSHKNFKAVGHQRVSRALKALPGKEKSTY